MEYQRVVSKYLRLMGVVVAMAVPGGLAAQATGTVSGTATDRETGAPLPTVQIYLEGTQFGGLSTATGTFTLSNVPPGTYTVIAQRIGY